MLEQIMFQFGNLVGRGSNMYHIVLQGRKPRSLEDVDKMDLVPDSPSLSNEHVPESLQVWHPLPVIGY